MQLLRNARVDTAAFVDCNRSGIFRLESVRAGRYALRGTPADADTSGSTRLMPTYDPNSDDTDHATFIDVGRGATISGLDIAIREVKTALLSGRVLDLASGKELWTFAYDAPSSFMFLVWFWIVAASASAQEISTSRAHRRGAVRRRVGASAGFRKLSCG